MLEKTNYVNMLFDFYQDLLKDTQREYFTLYYHDDLSLSEIAECKNVSRQAVYDQIRRVENLLIQYEKALGLFQKYTERKKLIAELKSAIAKKADYERLSNLVDRLMDIDEEGFDGI